MLIRSILTVAVLGSLFLGAAAQAEQRVASISNVSLSESTTIRTADRFATEGGLGGTR